MEKIRYRLVYNRKKTLNNQGCALIQIEAKLNQRNIYFSTNIYVQPIYWDKQSSKVINHPLENELNAFLFEKLINLQEIELSFWKRGIQPTLALLREMVRKKVSINLTFTQYARDSIKDSEKKLRTKENLYTTVRMLEDFCPSLDFPDLTYSFIKKFEHFLKERGNSVNTIAKHLRQLRTLINEAINDGYIPPDAYPFRKFKIKQERTYHRFLTPDELERMENVETYSCAERHVLDAFLFCCYTGIRYSDFKLLKNTNIQCVNNKRWLFLTMEKTGISIKLPLTLLFDGKSLNIIDKYDNIETLAHIPCNGETNRSLSVMARRANINKHITFHTSRHTCATILIYNGVALSTVQKILGHTSIKTTQIYSEVLSRTIVNDLQNIKKKRFEPE